MKLTKNRYITKSVAGMLAVLTLSVTGCKKFLDVNDNPNLPEEVDVPLIMPSPQAAIAHVVGNPFQIFGSIWGQYWTQSPYSSQYKVIDQYQPSSSSFDRPWGMLYNDALEDLQIIISNKGQEKYKQYAGIAYLLKAYDFQLITDAFGDAPLKDAGLGDENLNPRYDSQQEIYDSIFSYIDQGLALIDASSAFAPGSEDLVFQGDMEQWTAFGNTLKLRAYLRLSEVDADKAQAGIAALEGQPFLTVDAKIEYSTTGGNQNPLNAEMIGLGRTQNLVASATAVNAMKALNDPRVLVFYRPIPGTTTVTPIPQGSFNTTPTVTICTPSYIVGARASDPNSALAPVKLISAAESYFLQAEAAARGWLSGNAQQLYEQGITASFTSYDVDPGTYITDVVAQWPAGMDAQIEAIITQKYFAMCGNQGFEAWTEWRRTGYPTFFVRSEASVLGAGLFPMRMLYPNTELTRNSNFPGIKTITEKVWWDVE
ncbi:SusD/RagB family nutrient-binding outer membrane lipoprotein [Chitinophaga japonensis]|uniref:SusD-like starch-binding protein associating with outer membrane n=1 Tax=Chitinophaga japonensis TaxID=104662 RepID=A0A562TD12_CHIJA|nr:SusD/RagB family nutrient-binding outer membrane lipoprotein [Chitinophaga japonensis]TWI91409.1 SusD-like starch-binding protein associating with outer membrane [Chitinophaga japonensis]